MELAEIQDDAISFVDEIGLRDGFQATAVRHLGIARTAAEKRLSCSVVEPLIGLVLQGSKTAHFGAEQVTYRAGDVIVIGQPLPMISGVVSASHATPYIALYVGLDLSSLRSVFGDMGGRSSEDPGLALRTGEATSETIDAIGRLFRLRRDPVEEQTLGQAALREVYFRVLRSPEGAALRQTILADSKANQVAKAISHIRREYRSTIKASDLAAISGMSASVFYEAFKSVTANSPLQFQKDLRLTEAHRLLQHSAAPISEIAHTVGYESAAQFSREFSRKFGAPPRNFAAASMA